jgi:hypothetical protein
MDKTGTRRLLQVSGSIVADDGESPYVRYMIKPAATCHRQLIRVTIRGTGILACIRYPLPA